jgi:hypothetical protein
LKRIVTAAVTASLLGWVTGPPGMAETRQRDPDWRQRECRYQSLDQPTWTAREERLTAECALAHWSVSGGLSKFVQVGNCESGWNRLASNGGQYLGLFQHAAPYWSGRVGSLMPRAWRLGQWSRWQNSRAQIVVTARMVHSGGWGPWTCA